jgi:hypothetical protein
MELVVEMDRGWDAEGMNIRFLLINTIGCTCVVFSSLNCALDMQMEVQQ